MNLDKQDWETNDIPKTEKEKRNQTVERVERDMAGHKPSKTYKFAPLSKEEREKMKDLDMYGNPKKKIND